MKLWLNEAAIEGFRMNVVVFVFVIVVAVAIFSFQHGQYMKNFIRIRNIRAKIFHEPTDFHTATIQFSTLNWSHCFGSCVMCFLSLSYHSCDAV